MERVETVAKPTLRLDGAGGVRRTDGSLERFDGFVGALRSLERPRGHVAQSQEGGACGNDSNNSHSHQHNRASDGTNDNAPDDSRRCLCGRIGGEWRLRGRATLEDRRGRLRGRAALEGRGGRL